MIEQCHTLINFTWSSYSHKKFSREIEETNLEAEKYVL